MMTSMLKFFELEGVVYFTEVDYDIVFQAGISEQLAVSIYV